LVWEGRNATWLFEWVDYAREVRELPFLEVRFQIWSQEHFNYEDPVVEFVVWDGKWEMREPRDVLFKTDWRIEEEYNDLDAACDYAKRRPLSHNYMAWVAKTVQERLKSRGVV
jgi:hypothetical protein